jgi:hypothetical protein
MMFRSVSEHFANLRYVKDAKLVFEPECTISGYQSCEASIQNDVSEYFTAFANIRYVKDAKLAFEPECTISGYQSCDASILVHWTQNDVCEYFR